VGQAPEKISYQFHMGSVRDSLEHQQQYERLDHSLNDRACREIDFSVMLSIGQRSGWPEDGGDS
jgi:hypothetical protein